MCTVCPSQLPPPCGEHNGWQIVKDLVRVVLEHHGVIERNSGTKPGMVHARTTFAEVSDVDKDDSGTEHEDKKPPGPASTKVTKRVVVAHMNMKSRKAAWAACTTIAGNRLWRYDLNAAVYYGNERAFYAGTWELVAEPFSESEKALFNAEKAPQWQEPHELGDRFRITDPGGSRTWCDRHNEKATKGGTDTTKRKQHRVQEAPYMQARPRPDEGFHAGGGGGQYFPSWGWTVDWYGNSIPVYHSAWGQQMYGLPPFCASQHVGVVKESRYPTLEDIMARDQVAF
ncbi:MAG: hypothetical protein Q9193_005098 [Seirophora villosa]